MTNQRPVTNRRLYEGCVAGQIPAERLCSSDREWLLRLLHARGWTDVEIAVHTSMTTYTVGRIRSRIGLRPNASLKGAA